MIADSMRTYYEHSKCQEDNETMDLNDPKMVERLKRMADASYK